MICPSDASGATREAYSMSLEMDIQRKGAQSAAGMDAEPNPSRILLADDDHLVATGLASAVRSLGYEVVGPAPNGAMAVSLARTEAGGVGVDLAVLDIRMPVMSGVEAARSLWDEWSIPTVIASAYSDDEYVTQAREAGGVFGYLLKPITAESLRVAISVAWTRSVAERKQAGRIAQLEQNLRNRQVVERAKWKIVTSLGVSEPEAHSKLQRAARDQRRQLVEVAQQAIDATDLAFLLRENSP